MDKQSLAVLLEHGLSTERIARRFGKDPSTVSYWMKKHRLVSPYREKHAAKGGIGRERKEFNIALRGVARSLARLRAEARKCVLLCANCHSEVEGGIRVLPDTVPDAETTMA